MTQPAVQEQVMRWRDYVLLRGSDLSSFWRDHCQQPGRKLLFVVGRGFDPRTSFGLAYIAALAGTCTLDLLAIEFDEGESYPTQALLDAAASNWTQLQSHITNGTVTSRPIRFRSEDGRRIAARSAANVISRNEDITGYTDLIVDISSMPRAVYFPLISRLLFFHDELKNAAKPAPNIHVLVSEDPILDSQIREHGIDETASFLHPFEGEFNREATGVSPRIWIPVLGEGRTIQFDRIFDLVKPDEICPVLPSPSRNPRRGDNIVIEYRNLLFDLDPRNFIYSSELNPFEVYRQIRQTALHYHEVLGLIGGCKVAFSPLCSKLMSLGTLLVAYEMKTTGLLNAGIAHIECQGYEMPESAHPDVRAIAPSWAIWHD